MTNTKKRIGELFILGFRGREIPAWLRDFEKAHGLGGVILFDYDCQTGKFENNILSPAQLHGLCAQLSLLPSKPLIFVDQEGGKVRRLKEKLGFAPLPGAAEFGALPTVERERLAKKSFREMRDLGIHYNLAPVIDLNLNPENPDIGAIGRSFSDQAAVVRENAELLSRVAHSQKIGLSLKHFPGLGGARVNSHEALTDISDSIVEEQLELFYELGKTVSGGSVLVSHGIVKQWDPENPVSMSPVGISKLRDRLPDALLISDDLQMKALQLKYPTGEGCLRGLRAGLDMMLVGNNLMAEDGAILETAIAIEAERERDPALALALDSALSRVQKAKAAYP